jgi:hypothetical protein
MSYADLLKDRRWQQKRLEVLDSAGWECQNCGSTDNAVQLHVHHKKYRRGAKPWEYELVELQALCEPCHEKATEAIRKLDEAVDAIKVLGYVDEATGYLRTLCALDSGGTISVETYEHAVGVGAALYGSTADEVLDRTNGNTFDPCAMREEIETPPGIRSGKR